jgi:dTDP-4-dehydrorhamnose 3,5-epimerase-like enzyme
VQWYQVRGYPPYDPDADHSVINADLMTYATSEDTLEKARTGNRHELVVTELSSHNWRQLWNLWGFCTLKPNTEVVYKVTGDYDKASEAGVIWSDSDLALPWPVDPEEVVLSDKDRLLPRLRDAGTCSHTNRTDRE